jgi:adenosylcobinamide-phosphate guanylyltransferase
MTVTAIVMAGGKGTRMTHSAEKPLLVVGGKPVIDRVLFALKNARKVNDIVVAVTDSTPMTAKHVEQLGYKTLKTPGKEYVSDMAYTVRTLRLQTILTIAADMPLVTGEIIDDIITKYFASGKSALAVAVPAETKRKLQMCLGYAFECEGKQVVPAGINVNDGARIDEDELEQQVYIVDKEEVAVNINTAQELQIAQTQFAKTHKKE